MIPLRLTVKNFMCYRDNVPPLDLEGIHIACLCGENGHGKSALLDAITWVLWGQSRARTQEELIHQGRQDMAVDLEFLARGQRYRASRRYSRSTRGRQGATLLELQVASENGDRPITGNTVRETEARIREILHLDYDTFINTAFLLQGQADLFTRSSPTARKERLAEVLDLSYYQRLEERAKEESRSIQDRARDTENGIALRQQELVHKPEYQQKLASTNTALDRVEPEVGAQRMKVESLRAAVDSLSSRKGDLETLTHRLAASRSEIDELLRQVRSHEAKASDYEAILERDSEIREQYAALEEATAELERLNQALASKNTLDEERARLEKEVAVQRERLSGQADRLRNTITGELEPRAERLLQIEESLDATSLERAKLDEFEESIRHQRDEAQSIAARVRYLEEANASLLNEMEEARKKFDMLDQDDALCPLCKQPLGTEGQEHLRREYETEGKESKGLYQQHAAERDRLKKRHDELTTQTSEQQTELGQRRQQAQTITATQERDLEDSRKAQAELGPALEELERLQTNLRESGFALEEQHRLTELDSQLATLRYDGDKHRLARERVKALEPSSELHRRLLEALEALPAEREALETTRQMAGRRQQEVEQDENRREHLARKLESLPSQESALAEARMQYDEVDQERQNALVQQGVLTEQLERLAKLETELQGLEQKRRELVDERSIYEELAVAFGKNGIQALIIETAIPQLQDDANELLSRLSDGRLSLKLQLQEGRRERRLGLPSEELQILIGDEVGTRSYETFSGGEAFRINFALRIALSKLLARRSGAPLPTLFIDEGFGSQDSAGQERLKEAIQSIQSDFQKIIVITHVEEVKESFPTRIEVTKTSSGSTFVVV